MKKMLVIIVILAMILVSMIIYKNIAINKNKSVNVQEVEQIEEYISKIYMWKENVLPGQLISLISLRN